MTDSRPRRACYLSGPMTGLPGLNFPAFFSAEEKLRQAGWVVINPAREDTESPCPHTPGSPIAARFYARRDCSALLDALRAEDGDAIVVLPGWRRSKGARAENAVAEWVGLRRLTVAEAVLEGGLS